MLSNRYTIVVADRRTGVVRRFTIGLRSALAVVADRRDAAGADRDWRRVEGEGRSRRDLYAAQSGTLELENSSFRGATEALTGQIVALQAAISELGRQGGARSGASVRDGQAPGDRQEPRDGRRRRRTRVASAVPRRCPHPRTRSACCRICSNGIESRLRVVQLRSSRSAICWPRRRRRSGRPRAGSPRHWRTRRSRSPAKPITIPGLDISADKGTPVYATADGTVRQASYGGAYGNLVVVDHGYGLETRYGHLVALRVSPARR